MTTAVLFDLGSTLAAYYRRDEFDPILERAVAGVQQQLLDAGCSVLPFDAVLTRAKAENHEAADHRFAPLAERLARIFDVELAARRELDDRLCERFLEPIFAAGRAYADAYPTLEDLRARGLRTAIVS